MASAQTPDADQPLMSGVPALPEFRLANAESQAQGLLTEQDLQIALSGPGPWSLMWSLDVGSQRGRVLRLASALSQTGGAEAEMISVRVGLHRAQEANLHGRPYLMSRMATGAAPRPTSAQALVGIADDAKSGSVLLHIARIAMGDSAEPANAPIKLSLTDLSVSAVGVVGETHHEAITELAAHLLELPNVAFMTRSEEMPVGDGEDTVTVALRAGVVFPEGGPRPTDVVVWTVGSSRDAWAAWRYASPFASDGQSSQAPRAIRIFFDWRHAAESVSDAGGDAGDLALLVSEAFVPRIESLLGGERAAESRFVVGEGLGRAAAMHLSDSPTLSLGGTFLVGSSEAPSPANLRIVERAFGLRDEALLTPKDCSADPISGVKCVEDSHGLDAVLRARMPEIAAGGEMDDLAVALAAALVEAGEAEGKRVEQADHEGTCSTCGHNHGPGEHHHPAPAPKNPLPPVKVKDAEAKSGGKR